MKYLISIGKIVFKFVVKSETLLTCIAHRSSFL